MPTRYLKPGVRDSDLIDSLSPMAEILFYRLLVTVDDFGRFDARPSMIKSSCFPVKEDVTSKECNSLLEELFVKGLIDVYMYENKPFLQFLKWDNVPRASESKFPIKTDTCTNVYNCIQEHTNVPLTETKTETKTKTETLTLTEVAPQKKSAATSEKTPLQEACKSTWIAYSNAYFDRYGTEPVRNTKVNSLIKNYVQRIGHDESPHVAAFYVGSNNSYYISRAHCVDCLLADAEKLRTEWVTGSRMTRTKAMQADKMQNNFDVVDEAMRILQGNAHG